MTDNGETPKPVRKSWIQKLGFFINPKEYSLNQIEELQKKGYRFNRKADGRVEVTERVIIAGDDQPKDPREIT